MTNHLMATSSPSTAVASKGAGIGIGVMKEKEATSEIEWPLINRVLSYLSPFWKMVSILVVTTALGAYVDTLLPTLYRSIVDEALPNGDMDQLGSLTLLMLGLVSLKSLLKVARSWLASITGERIAEQLRSELFVHLQTMPMSFFVHKKPGEFTALFTSELASAKQGIGRVFPRVTSSLLTLLFTLFGLVSLDYRLAVITLFMIPLFQLPTSLASRFVKRAKEKGIAAAGSLTNTVQESLSMEGWLLHKVFQMDSTALHRFQRSNHAASDASIQFDRAHALLEQGLYLSVTLCTTLMYYIAGSYSFSSSSSISLSPGNVVMFASYIGRLFGPVKDLMNVRLLFVSAVVSFAKLFTYLDMTPNAISTTLHDASGREEEEDLDGQHKCDLHVSNVSCGYLNYISSDVNGSQSHDKDKLVLQKLSFSIEGTDDGVFVALVGKNGAGKSTLALVLSRLLDFDEGIVEFDGHDLRGMSPSLLKHSVCLVGRSFMINDTVKANLLYGNPSASMEDIENVCRVVGLAKLISEMPLGYDTVLGERGFRFSGGESQRLSVARGLLAAPSVLILDEALSHVDTTGEAALLNAIKPLRKGKITLLISHRYSTVSSCDRIMVIDDGMIVEQGSLQELRANDDNSRFKRLFDL